MQFGLLISVLMHVVILGGALISIQSRPEARLPETEPVAVGMIAPGDVTKVKQGVRTAKLLEAAEAKESPNGDLAKKEASRPKMASTAPPPPPPSAPEEKKAEPAPPKVAEPPPPAAEEAKKKHEAEQHKLAEEKRLAEAKQRAEEQAKAEAEALQRAEEQKLAEEKKIAEQKKIAEEHRLAEEKKRAEEEQKRLEEQRKQAELKKKRDAEKKRQAELRKKREAEKKRHEEEKQRLADEAAKKQSFSDKMSALLNKIPDAAPPPPSTAGDKATKAKGPTLGAPDGKDRELSASERGLIIQAIKSCVQPRWNVLSGGASARETVVKIRIRFNADGTLSAPPEIKPPPGTPTPYFRAISESALRAVQECEPYNLPPDLYDHWKDILMSFSPTDMY